MTQKSGIIIAAYPEEEILGCGGTVCKMIQAGWTFHTVILTQGNCLQGEALRKCAEKANGTIGIQRLTIHDFPYNAMDTLSLREIIQKIDTEIQQTRPQILFTHFGDDLIAGRNTDHRITFQAVLEACKPRSGERPPDIYAYLTPSATDCVDGTVLPPFQPNVYVDIRSTISSKLQALSQYSCEKPRHPEASTMESIRDFARHWGRSVGWEEAEPFLLVRKTGDL